MRCNPRVTCWMLFENTVLRTDLYKTILYIIWVDRISTGALSCEKINGQWADPRAFLCQVRVAAIRCVLRATWTGHGVDCGCQAALHKVHHRVHNIPKFMPIISRSNSVHAIFFDVCKTNFNINISSKSWSWKCSLYFNFPHQNPVITSFPPIHSTFPAHLIHLDLSPE